MGTFPTAWSQRAAACVAREPLFETRSSLASLRRVAHAPAPRAVFLGVGLCSQNELTEAVPLDVLGMLLPADALRDAIGAGDLVVVIADRHALENGFSEATVQRRAREVEGTLRSLRERCGLSRMTLLRASSFHDELDYRRTLAEVRRRAADRGNGYVHRQLADAVYLDRRFGGVLKVGWTIRGSAQRDEVAFDRALEETCTDRVGFAYCKPGRTLSDTAPRMPPYLTTRPEVRICLSDGESPAAKLAEASRHASPETVEGCRRHLKAIVYTYGRQVERLPRGPLERRLHTLVRRLAAPERIAAAAAEG